MSGAGGVLSKTCGYQTTCKRGTALEGGTTACVTQGGLLEVAESFLCLGPCHRLRPGLCTLSRAVTVPLLVVGDAGPAGVGLRRKNGGHRLDGGVALRRRCSQSENKISAMADCRK